MIDVAFIKIDILENWRFWHQFGDNFEEAGREVVAQADALLAGDEDANARAAQLLQDAKFFRQKKVAAGKLGGRPKKDSNGNPRPGESANLSNAPKSHTAAVPGDQAEGAKSLPANGRGKIPGIGEFKNVKITPEERQKLEARFGDVSGLIEELSDYLKNHPKKYSDHYAALRSWARRRVADGKSINGGKKMTQGEELADYYARREWEILNGNG